MSRGDIKAKSYDEQKRRRILSLYLRNYLQNYTRHTNAHNGLNRLLEEREAEIHGYITRQDITVNFTSSIIKSIRSMTLFQLMQVFSTFVHPIIRHKYQRGVIIKTKISQEKINQDLQIVKSLIIRDIEKLRETRKQNRKSNLKKISGIRKSWPTVE